MRQTPHLSWLMRPRWVTMVSLGLAGCASAHPSAPPALVAGHAPPHAADASASRARGASCVRCPDVVPMPVEIARALEARVDELKQRGGVCTLYGGVLENSYRSGRITLRPYMWRVGGRLASGQATPSGEMTLAREIDSLNVGLRTVDDVVWSMEHEAVHIALRIESAEWPREDGADSHVRACRRPRTDAEATRSTRGR